MRRAKGAFLDPCHSVAIVGAAIVAIMGWPVLGTLGVALLFVGLDALYLGIAAEVPALRRRFDRRVQRRIRAQAAEQRASLLERMSRSHRRELLRIECAIDGMTEGGAARGAPVQLVADACRALLAKYVELAIAYETTRRAAAADDGDRLRAEASALEGQITTAPPVLRRLLERRAAIARRRAHLWEQSHAGMESLAMQLAAIAERIRLAQEECAAPDEFCTEPQARVRIASDFDDGELVGELLRRSAVEPVDPRVLELGRDAMEASSAS